MRRRLALGLTFFLFPPFAWSQGFGGGDPHWCGTPDPLPGASQSLLPGLPTLGTQHVLVVPVDNDSLNGTDFDHADVIAFMGEVEGWFESVSYGKYRVQAYGGPAGPGMDSVMPEYNTTTTSQRATPVEAILHWSQQGVAVEDWDLFVFLETKSQGILGGQRYVPPLTFELADGSLIQREAVVLYKPGQDADTLRVMVHEIGHALGLNHGGHINPSTGRNLAPAYNNEADPMGSDAHGGPPHFSAPHKDLLGWFDSDEILDVNGPGIHVLHPMSSSSGLKALRIHSKPSNEYTGFVEYRRPQGEDAYMAGYHNLTDGAILSTRRFNSIPITLDATPESPSKKSKDCALTEGRTYTFEDDYTVAVLEHDEINDLLTVEVTMADPTNRPPVLGAVIVEDPGAPGGTVTLRVEAVDPEGDAVRAFWCLQGDPFSDDYFYESGDYASGTEVVVNYPVGSTVEKGLRLRCR